MTKTRVQKIFIIAFALSVVLHILVVSGVLLTRSQPKPLIQAQAPVKIVEATAINQTDIDREVNNLRNEQIREERQRTEEIERYQQSLQSTISQRNQEQQRLANLNKTNQELAAKLKEDQLKIQEETRKQAELKKQREQMEQQAKLEQARLAKLAAEQKATQLKQEREAQALKKAKEERELAEQAAKKLKEEQLAKIKAEQHDIQQKALLDQLSSEQNKISATLSKLQAKEVAKYKERIIAAIAHSWRVPVNADKSLSCELLINVAPGGTVIEVQTLRSSGNSAMDRSARTAVFKASPLPVPTKEETFNAFRVLRVTVRPEQILNS